MKKDSSDPAAFGAQGSGAETLAGGGSGVAAAGGPSSTSPLIGAVAWSAGWLAGPYQPGGGPVGAAGLPGGVQEPAGAD